VKAFALSTLMSIGFLSLSIIYMRRQRLREQTALLWFFVTFVMVLVSTTLPTHVLDRLSLFVGIAYPPAFLLLLAVLFLMFLVFHLSLSLDRLSRKQTILVQELGLLTASRSKPTETESNETGSGSASLASGPSPPSR